MISMTLSIVFEESVCVLPKKNEGRLRFPRTSLISS